MIRICSVVLFVIQVIIVQCDDQTGDDATPLSSNVPRQCWHPPREVNPHECCPIPSQYSEEQFAACGIVKPSGPPPGPPPSGQRPHGPPPGKPGPPGPPDCSKTLCLLKNSDQLNDDDSLNFEKIANYTDHWAKANPEFADAILIAKKKCITDQNWLSNENLHPPICDADKMMFCIHTKIFWNCKLKEDLPQCQVLKTHMEECKEYFP